MLHDLQQILGVTLAMAGIVSGHAINKCLNSFFQSAHVYWRQAYPYGRHRENRRYLIHILQSGDLSLSRRRPPSMMATSTEGLGVC